MAVRGVEPGIPSDKSQNTGESRKKKHAVGSYGQRSVQTTFTNKAMGHKPEKLSVAEKRALKKAEKAAAAEAANNNPKADNESRDYSDPYSVVIELAKIADAMDANENPEMLSMLNTMIRQFLKDIDERQEREHERQQEERDQDRINDDVQKVRREKERTIQEMNRLKQVLATIEANTHIREQYLDNLSRR